MEKINFSFNVGLRIVIFEQWDDTCIPFTSNIVFINDATVSKPSFDGAIIISARQQPRPIARSTDGSAAAKFLVVVVLGHE